MISCPNCQHQNPDGATQCEACYTPLPVESSCPNCGAPIQSNATFCGQCGFNIPGADLGESTPVEPDSNAIPPTIALREPEPVVAYTPPVEIEAEPEPVIAYTPPVEIEAEPVVAYTPPVEIEAEPEPVVAYTPPVMPSPIPEPEPITLAEINQPPVATGGATRLQIQTASLFHVQTGTKLELQQNLSVIHIGKPNEQIPPDIDVSGFPNSEIVSRVHSDIRVEGDSFFIEDVGSSNGTYVNHTPLLEGNRHRLRPGDRIALGKGDKMTFIFQMS